MTTLTEVMGKLTDQADPAQLDGMVLVAMSDLHADSVPGNRWLAARVAQVQAERPHLVEA